MLATIIKKELLANLLSLRIAICYGIIGLLVVFSITIRGLHYTQEAVVYHNDLLQYDEESKKNEKQWAVYNVRIAPRKLGIFHGGFSESISRPFLVDIKFALNRPLGDYALESPVLSVYRAYDLLFITAFIVSLLVIFISYDSLAGEREQGTFRLLLTNRVSKSTLILGKLAGGALSVTLPYLASVGAGLLVLQLGLGIPFTLKEYALLGAFVGLAVIFIITVYLFSMLCSAVCRTSATALFTCLCLWLVAAFGVPYFGVYAARTVKPSLTFGEYRNRIKDMMAREQEGIRKETRELRKNFTGKDFLWEERMAHRRMHNRMGQKWNAERAAYRQKLRNQAETGIALARLSPVGLLVTAGSNFTQTGMAARYHAETWKENLERANKQVFDHESSALELVNRQREIDGQEPLQLWDQPFDRSNLPNRIYPGIPFSGTVRGSLADLVILCLQAVALFMATYLFFVRKHDA